MSRPPVTSRVPSADDPPYDDRVDVEHGAPEAHRVDRVGDDELVPGGSEQMRFVVESGVAGFVQSDEERSHPFRAVVVAREFG